MDLRCQLSKGEREPHPDVVELVAFHSTGQTTDLTEAIEWFTERISIDYPEQRFSQGPPQSIPKNAPPEHKKTQRNKSTIPLEAPKSPAKLTARVRRIHNRPRKEKTPTMGCGKNTDNGTKKTPTYIPVVLWGMVSPEELKDLLLEYGQHEWTTRVRMSGLLCLLSFIIQKCRKKKTEGVAISQGLSRDYVSSHTRPKQDGTIREPLNLLKEIGLIEETSPYQFTPYRKCSAKFQLSTSPKRTTFKHSIQLTPKIYEKLKGAKERQAERLKNKHQWRAQLLKDQKKVSLSKRGWKKAAELKKNPNKAPSTKSITDLISGKVPPRANADNFGSILTSFISCPKPLKPHLLLNNEPVALCDVAHAHWCLLPLLAEDHFRNGHESKRPPDLPPALCEEIGKLADYLSNGDLYQKLGDGQTRKETKKHMLRALNYKNPWNQGCRPYQAMKKLFPRVFSLIEDIKRYDHRAISSRLRHHTATVIRGSLLKCQRLGIPAIPDTDCIICPKEHEEIVSRIIGEHMYNLTEVRCLVGGIRYNPSPAPASASVR